MVGSTGIGSKFPVVVQSMTKLPTTDVTGCVRQINQLVKAGCDLVRISVPRKADTEAFCKIVQKVSIPLIADIHFSPQRAVEAIEAGACKIRLNPGNIKSTSDINKIIDSAKAHSVAIRIGVNEASIRDLKKQQVPAKKRVALMLAEMKKYIRIFEKRGFDNIVLSAKSSDALRTIEINRAVSQTFDYPIHLGLTHAGLPDDALVPSAVAIGTLLAEGTGDTIRISVAGNPVREIKIAKDILLSLGLIERTGPELIVCPTCARAEVDIIQIAKRVKKLLDKSDKSVRVAVMGCIVNGPGEAADADIAVCAGKGKGFIYKQGRKVSTVAEADIPSALAGLLGL